MEPEFYSLALVPSPDDAPVFTPEYQAELKQFADKAEGGTQLIALKAGAGSGGAGPLGEFIYGATAVASLIHVLKSVAVIWVKTRQGRKLKLQFGNGKAKVKLEANTVEEIEAMIKAIPEAALKKTAAK